MPPGIVDFLQPVDITDGNGQLLNVFAPDFLIDSRFMLGIGILVSYARQRIRCRYVEEGPADFFLRFKLAPGESSQLLQKDKAEQHHREQCESNLISTDGKILLADTPDLIQYDTLMDQNRKLPPRALNRHVAQRLSDPAIGKRHVAPCFARKIVDVLFPDFFRNKVLCRIQNIAG